MRGLVILGAKEHAKVVLATFQDTPHPEWNVLGFLDDNAKLQGTKLLGLPVLGPMSLLDELKKQGKVHGALIGVSCGHMPVRARLFEKAKSLGLEIPTVVSPAAFVHRTATVGQGAVVLAGAVIHAFATVGDNFVAYSNAAVEHECVLGNNVYLGPGVCFCANVKVGDNTFIATGASVICPSVGADVIIGAGAAVVDNIPDGAVAAGVPARILKKRDESERGRSYTLRKEDQAA